MSVSNNCCCEDSTGAADYMISEAELPPPGDGPASPAPPSPPASPAPTAPPAGDGAHL